MAARVVSPQAGEATLLDWSQIEAAIASPYFQAQSRGRSFLLLCLHTYFGIEPILADEVITDGGGDRGIDAIIIDEQSECLHIVTCKSVTRFDQANKNFPGTEVDKILQFVADLIQKRPALLIGANPILASKVKSIWDYLEKGRRFEISAHVLSNMQGFIAHDRNRLREGLRPNRIALVEAHLSEISDGLAHNFDPPSSRTLRLLDQQRFECVQAGNRMVVGNCLLSAVAAFVRDPERTGQFDRRLLHQNVRGVLDGEQPIHQMIQKTLSSERVSQFPFLNNGITIVCDSYTSQVGGNFPLHLARPQIVNGAQTAFCIFEVARAQPESFNNTSVGVRIIETKDRSLRDEIAVATNSQARIFSRDLRANDDVSKKLSSGIERLGYFYKRRRGDSANIESDRVIDALRLGQSIFSTVLDAPHLAKTNSNQVFGIYFDRVFNPSVVSPEFAISLHKLDVAARTLKDRLSRGIKSAEAEVEYGEHWAVEGVFHLIWLAYFLASAETAPDRRCEAACRQLPNAASWLDSYYNKLERLSAYRIFRSAATVGELKRLVLGPQANKAQLELPFQRRE